MVPPSGSGYARIESLLGIAQSVRPRWARNTARRLTRPARENMSLKVCRVLISVSDKTGVIELGQALATAGVVFSARVYFQHVTKRRH